MKALMTVLSVCILYGCVAVPELTHEERVARVLERTPLIDGHNDMPGQYRRRVNNRIADLDLASDLTLLERPTHTDIPRLRTGRVGGQFWSVYVSVGEYGGSPDDVQRVIEQIDLVHRLVARHSDDLEMAYSAADIRRIHTGGRIASLIGIEGGHAINDSLAVLRQMYVMGARYMTLTHSKGLRWVDSATDTDRHGGLTDFGRIVVGEMNRLGMLVDLSHVSPAVMRDVLETSEAPVIFSHSSAYAEVPHVRNVPDDILRLVGEKEGVVMVTFYPSYVSEDRRIHSVSMMAERARLAETTDDAQVIADGVADWLERNPVPMPTLAQVADHIDHIRQVAGVEHIGIGGDFDGMPPGPVGLEDVSKYPGLFEELLHRGYSESDIAMIAGENVLRVMEAAEEVAARLQQRTEPAHAFIDDKKLK